MASFVPRALALLITVGILCWGAVAQAQSSPAAQALFDEGVSLRSAGKIEQACSKFEESLRLDLHYTDPTPLFREKGLIGRQGR